MGTLAFDSASSTAFLIERTTASRLAITPLRQPLDSAAPHPSSAGLPLSLSWQIKAQVLLLPTSSALMKSFLRATRFLSVKWERVPGTGRSGEWLVTSG